MSWTAELNKEGMYGKLQFTGFEVTDDHADCQHGICPASPPAMAGFNPNEIAMMSVPMPDAAKGMNRLDWMRKDMKPGRIYPQSFRLREFSFGCTGMHKGQSYDEEGDRTYPMGCQIFVQGYRPQADPLDGPRKRDALFPGASPEVEFIASYDIPYRNASEYAPAYMQHVVLPAEWDRLDLATVEFRARYTDHEHTDAAHRVYLDDVEYELKSHVYAPME